MTLIATGWDSAIILQEDYKTPTHSPPPCSSEVCAPFCWFWDTFKNIQTNFPSSPRWPVKQRQTIWKEKEVGNIHREDDENRTESSSWSQQGAPFSPINGRSKQKQLLPHHALIKPSICHKSYSYKNTKHNPMHEMAALTAPPPLLLDWKELLLSSTTITGPLSSSYPYSVYINRVESLK